MKAAVLAIGTELTTGQTLNRNAQWISTHLAKMGFSITHHLTVPDDREIISKSLNFLEDQVDLLFVTGGLGPTADDFTRDLISEWGKMPLQFDESSFAHVSEIITARGQVVRDTQKQQCYFPTGAYILFNSQGTANGFNLKYKDTDVYVLPGPPSEIEAIWNDHIQDKLLDLVPIEDQWKVYQWDTMGLGESEVAHRVEKLFNQFNFESAYRVHRPYVEVKLHFQNKRQSEAHQLAQLITSELQPILVSQDGKDIVHEFALLCRNKRVIFYSDQSHFDLIQRVLVEFERNSIQVEFRLESQFPDTPPKSHDQFNKELYFGLFQKSPSSALVAMQSPGQLARSLLKTSPFKIHPSLEPKKNRFKSWIIEVAILQWIQDLNNENKD